MKRVTVVALSVVMLIGIGCSGTTFRAKSDFSLTQPWEGYERVEVRMRNGSVEIRSAAVDEIHVSGLKSVGGLTLGEAEANLEQVTIYAGTHADRPDTFLVEVRYPETLKRKSVAASVVLELPEPCSAKVKSSNGSISVERLSGEVVLATSNGRVHVVDVAGDVDAETSNGRIEARNVAGDLSAKSSNGRIVAEGIQGDCVLTTSNGKIRFVAAPTTNGRVELRTSNGSIHATLPHDLAAELKLRTSNGRVRVSLGEASLKLIDSGKTRFNAVMNGGGGTVIVTTSNGSILVDSP